MKAHTTATLNGLRMSPRKVRLLIDLIRGKKVNEALAQLQFAGKKAATPIIKLLNSAIANAVHNEQLDADTLVVQKATVDGGPILYRWMPRAMGRATPLRKRTSHVTIELEGEVLEKAIKKEKKKKEKMAESIDGKVVEEKKEAPEVSTSSPKK